MKFAIDAGHGNNTPGKRSPDGSLREFYFNNAVALEVTRILRNEYGQTVYNPYDVTGKIDTPLNTRVQRANASKVDAFISIHANAAGNGWNSAEGLETFIYNVGDQPGSLKLAANVQNHLVRDTGLKNRGVARSLLGQAGLSEEYIPLMEDLMKNNPDMSPNELFSRTREQIKQQEEGNKTLREIERTWLEFKVELARSLLEVGIGDILKSISDSLRELVDLMRGYKDWSDGDSTSAQVWRFFKGTWKYGNPITGPGNIAEAITEAIKNISNTESGNVTNNIYSTNNNALTVSSTQEAADYVQEQENNSLTAQYWNLNSAYRMAPTNGG